MVENYFSLNLFTFKKENKSCTLLVKLDVGRFNNCTYLCMFSVIKNESSSKQSAKNQPIQPHQVGDTGIEAGRSWKAEHVYGNSLEIWATQEF